MRGRRSPWLAVLALLWAGLALAAAPAQYAVVEPGRTLEFPRDFGAHPDYRTEWWYITGWLADDAGTARGFQVTFFRVRTLRGEHNPSLFAPRQLILAHAAVSDPQLGRLRHAERVARALPPLAEVSSGGHVAARLGDWSLLQHDDGHYSTSAGVEDFSFALDFTTTAPPVLRGDTGFSQKTADPRNASHYYSRPQLAVQGTLTLAGAPRTVHGVAWLDHEWSSEILPPEARGWDWVGLNLDDGSSLMAFQMRDHAGRALWATAHLVPPEGGAGTRSAPHEVAWTARRHWRSPRTGIDFPVAWQLRAGDRTFELEPLFDDQELDSRASTGAVYWEGAVRVLEHGQPVGRGYLEMTGHGERLTM